MEGTQYFDKYMEFHLLDTFADYFNLSHNTSTMKQQLKRFFDTTNTNYSLNKSTQGLYQEQKLPYQDISINGEMAE